MGACSSKAQVVPAPNPPANPANTAASNPKTMGNKTKPNVKLDAKRDAKHAGKKNPQPTFFQSAAAATASPKKIYGIGAKLFTEMFDTVEIDSKNDNLILTFPSSGAASKFHEKIKWDSKDGAIILNDKKLSVKIRVNSLYPQAPSAYKAVIDSIVDNTAYFKCQAFIMAIRDFGDAGTKNQNGDLGDAETKKQNGRIIAVLNIVGVWSRKVYQYRISSAEKYDAKKEHYINQADVDAFKQYVGIIKSDPLLHGPWSKLSLEKLEDHSQGCLASFLRCA